MNCRSSYYPNRMAIWRVAVWRGSFVLLAKAIGVCSRLGQNKTQFNGHRSGAAEKKRVERSELIWCSHCALAIRLPAPKESSASASCFLRAAGELSAPECSTGWRTLHEPNQGAASTRTSRLEMSPSEFQVRRAPLDVGVGITSLE